MQERKVNIDQAQKMLSIVQEWGQSPEIKADLGQAHARAENSLLALVLTGVASGLLPDKPLVNQIVLDKLRIAFEVGYYCHVGQITKKVGNKWDHFYRHEPWKGADDQEMMRQFDLYMQDLTRLLNQAEWLGCTPETPCCDRRGEYNGFGSGELKFVCPKHCACHD